MTNPFKAQPEIVPDSSVSVKAYRRACDARAMLVVDEVSPGVSFSDMPSQWTLEQRVKGARALAGESGRDVSRRALGLEMHTREAYWDRAQEECSAIFDKHAALAAENGNMGYVKSAFSAMEMLQENALDSGTHKGDTDAIAMFVDMATRKDVAYDERERRTLAGHALVHTRAHNRHCAAFEKLQEDLPKTSPDLMADVSRSGASGFVMILSEKFAKMSTADLVVSAQEMRSSLLTQVQGEGSVATSSDRVAELLKSENVHALAQKRDARASSLEGKPLEVLMDQRKANNAVLALYPAGGERQFGLLAIEIAHSKRVQEMTRQKSSKQAGVER